MSDDRERQIRVRAAYEHWPPGVVADVRYLLDALEAARRQYAELRAVVLRLVAEPDRPTWSHQQVLTLAECHVQDSEIMDARAVSERRHDE